MAKINLGITCLWDSRSTNSIIKRQNNNLYDRKLISDKLESITATGTYCMTHAEKVKFCMPDLSSSNIILHHFHVDNHEGD